MMFSENQHKDYYINNPSELNGRPKETIGDYVRENGFLVPKIINSLDDALKFRGKVIARSEHNWEYAFPGTSIGFSDLSKSFILENKKQIIQTEIDSSLLQQRLSATIPEALKENEDQIEFSFWEYISGINASVVADSGVEGRIHIYMKREKTKAYYQINNDKITDRISPIGLISDRILENLIEVYSAVRGLERFDPLNCPVIELQIADFKKQIYFLQYLRTQDEFFNEYSVEKLRGVKKFRANWVRGATPKTGFELYISGDHFKTEQEKDMPKEEDILRKTDSAHYVGFQKGPEGAAGSHYRLSAFFKPKISINLPLKMFAYKGVKKGMDFQIYSNGHEACFLDI